MENTLTSSNELLAKLIEQNNALMAMLEKKKQPKVLKPKGKTHKNLFTKKEIQVRTKLRDFQLRTRSNGSYELRYRKHGLNVSFCSKTMQGAKEKALEWLNRYENDLDEIIQSKKDLLYNAKMGKPKEPDRVNFGEFSLNFMMNVKKQMVKENTFEGLMNVYKNHIESKYKDMYVDEITPQVLQPHFTEMHEKYPRTCEQTKGIMSNIFEYALNNGLIRINPMKSVFVPKHQRTTGQALTMQEELRFVEAIQGTYYESMFLKMLYTGVRPCEVNTIVENDDNTITIKNGKLKSYQKNYYRTLPMFPYYKQFAKGPVKHVDTNKMGCAFTKYCPNHQLKDLRHTFTTRARECGIDNEVVALWTGHSLGNITSSIYTHFSMDFQQKEAEKLKY